MEGQKREPRTEKKEGQNPGTEHLGDRIAETGRPAPLKEATKFKHDTRPRLHSLRPKTRVHGPKTGRSRAPAYRPVRTHECADRRSGAPSGCALKRALLRSACVRPHVCRGEARARR